MTHFSLIPFYEIVQGNLVVGVCNAYKFSCQIEKDNGLRYGLISEADYKLYKKKPWTVPKSTSQFGRPILTTTKHTDLLYIGSANDKNCGFADLNV